MTEYQSLRWSDFCEMNCKASRKIVIPDNKIKWSITTESPIGLGLKKMVWKLVARAILGSFAIRYTANLVRLYYVLS